MKVCFPGSVRRIVANLPAAAVEKSLPVLQHIHSMPLAPAEPFAAILRSYLVELSTGNHALKLGDGDLLVENICNLLRVIAHRQDVYMTPRELQRAAIARFVSRHASNPDLSLDDAAAHLKMSSRLIQKVLHEQGTSFSNMLLQEGWNWLGHNFSPATTGYPASPTHVASMTYPTSITPSGNDSA